MIAMAFFVAFGLIAMFAKLSWKNRLWLLSHPLMLDLGVFTLLNVLHWGTFSGVMVAAIGALMCSLCISIGRRAFGFIDKGNYRPGWLDVGSKLK